MDLYLDFVSPYAYLAWRRHGALLPDVAMRPRVILLGPVLEHHGQLGPAEIPAKRAFTVRDTLRRAAEADVPLVWPERHPFKSVLAAKVAHAVADADRSRVIAALFAVAWGEGNDLEDRAVVHAAIAAAGLDADAVLATSASPETSASLRAATKEAIDRGVFGVPTFVDDDDELFFGDDQIERVARKRSGRDPLGASLHREAERVIARPLGVDRRVRK